LLVPCPAARLTVDQADPGVFQLPERPRKVLNRNCYMVKALPALGEGARKGRIFGGSLEQLQAAFANLKHRHAYLLLLDNFFRVGWLPQQFFENRARGRKRADCDANVVNFGFWILDFGLPSYSPLQLAASGPLLSAFYPSRVPSPQSLAPDT
jgi:hypothetical protein